MATTGGSAETAPPREARGSEFALSSWLWLTPRRCLGAQLGSVRARVGGARGTMMHEPFPWARRLTNIFNADAGAGLDKAFAAVAANFVMPTVKSADAASSGGGVRGV